MVFFLFQNSKYFLFRRDPEQPEIHGVQLSEWHLLSRLQLYAAAEDKEEF